MNMLLDALRRFVRGLMHYVAVGLNRISGGHVSPNLVTIVGLVMHVPIAILIAQGYFGYAAGLLVVFGLFDTLDGELARLQKRANAAGMLLDASTDRMKEVLLYSGAAFVLASQAQPEQAVWAVTATGASLVVSYIKAKGETAVKDAKLTPSQINRLFQDGLARFEVRMGLLVIGLLISQLHATLVIITLLSTYTAFQRLIAISRKLI